MVMGRLRVASGPVSASRVASSPSRTPRGSVPKRSTWKPGQPCDWGRTLAVVAAYKGVGRHSYRLKPYVGPGKKLHTSVGHAGQWSSQMMNRYPQYFSDSDRAEALEMMQEAYGKVRKGDELEKDYDANRSWFGVRVEPADLSNRRANHKTSGYTYKCKEYPHCTRVHPTNLAEYKIEHVVRWPLRASDPDWGSYRFRSNGLNTHAIECCKDLTVGKVYLAPVMPDEADVLSYNYPDIVGRTFGAAGWTTPIYYTPAAPPSMANTLNANHPAFAERIQLRSDMEVLDAEAANIMRCVEAGVAWRISFGLNKRRALQGQSR